MTAIPPRLSAKSADVMRDVVDSAGDAIESGVDPDTAVAKAAADHKLPVHHVPYVVRAINTELAVKQLGADDVWAKAASYPTATISKVIEKLGGTPPTVKQAADLSDYATPPTVTPRVLPRMVEKQAADLSPDEKPYDQSAWTPRWAKTATDRGDNRLSVQFKAARLVDEAADLVRRMTPAQYAAVKVAVARTAASAAKFLFDQMEGDDNLSDLGVKAAKARPDVTVTVEHRVVKIASELEGLRFVPTAAGKTPDGYEKVASTGRTDVFKPAARCPILGVVIKPTAPPTEKAAEAPAPDLLAGAPVLTKAAGFGAALSGFGDVASIVPRVAQRSQFLRDSWPSVGEGGSTPGADPKLQAGLGRIDTQSAVQNLLTDSRFAKVDPKTVVGTYHQYASLAPQAMANPALAADFIQRRIQTGPLSYYDLKALTDIEHNLTRIRRGGVDGGDDD